MQGTKLFKLIFSVNFNGTDSKMKLYFKSVNQMETETPF